MIGIVPLHTGKIYPRVQSIEHPHQLLSFPRNRGRAMETSLESNFTPAAAFRVYRLFPNPPWYLSPSQPELYFLPRESAEVCLECSGRFCNWLPNVGGGRGRRALPCFLGV